MGYKCKFCDKNYPCGRSLGGHMRSHMHPGGIDKPVSRKCFVAAGTGYGLREKPKRTWRISDQDIREMQGNFCIKCKKGFPSKNSLFGHMKSHSEGSSNCKALVREADEEGYERLEETDDNEEMVSHNGKRRSRRLTSIQGSSSLQVKFDKEQHDIALILVTLSKEITFSASTSPGETSRNRNVDLDSESVDIKRNLDQRNARKGLEFDVSDAAFDEDYDDFDIRMSDDYDDEFKVSDEGSMICCPEDNALSKKVANDACDAKSNTKHMEMDMHNILNRKRRYKCDICSRSFRSYQALGGHRSSHNRLKGCLEPEADGSSTSKNSIENMSKKIKVFKCPICRKVFSSGQALGGHKRSHFLTKSGYEGPSACQYTMVIQPQHAIVPDMPDLNLPASIEGDVQQ